MVRVQSWRTATVCRHGPELAIKVPANVTFAERIVFVIIAGPMAYGYVRICIYPDLFMARSFQDLLRTVILALVIGAPLALALRKFAEQTFGFQELCVTERHLERRCKAMFWTRSRRYGLSEIETVEAVSGNVLATVRGRKKKLLEGLSIESAGATAGEVRQAITHSGLWNAVKE